MSLRAPIVYCIPDETERVARAAFPKGNPYLRMRDALGPIYINPEFAALFSHTGQPAYAPAHLALVTIMQFAEGLSDAQAAAAVASRIDWKYALALELTDAGFDASVLCEFRSRLLAGHTEALLFDTMLTLFREQDLLKGKGRQRTDATHVLAAIHTLNRLELLGETLRHALNVLATAAPAWLQAWVPAEWVDRYRHRFDEYRLPTGQAARTALAAQLGADGRTLLQQVADPTPLAGLRDLPAVQVLRQVWLQQFYAVTGDQLMQWRAPTDLPPAALLINSPYDPEARYGQKRATEWTGYKVHLTETCTPHTPNLITAITTTPATTSDAVVLPAIQANLAQRDLVPDEQLVDAGYMTADHLVTSARDHGIGLVGPVGEDQSPQARARDGFAAAQFVLDWDAEQAICPQGATSVRWQPGQERQGQPMIRITFAAATCAACPVRQRCTQAARGPRQLQVQARAQYLALQAARERQQSAAFKAAYGPRAGIEGTLAQGTRLDLRRSRYVGLAKTRLQHLLVAAALNFVRVAAWLAETPRSKTRRSAFAALMGAPL